MMNVESVIVTVRTKQNAWDMELPAFLQIDQLEMRLLETLRFMNPGQWGNIARLSLYVQGQKLKDEDTLASLGLWDGSILDICGS